MISVIRRFAPVLALLLVLSACAGSSRSAIEAGGQTISRGELANITNSLNGATPDAEPSALLSADDFRFNGTIYIRSLVFLDYFDAQGLLTDEVEAEAADQISDLFNQGNIGPLEFQGPEYNAVVTILTASQLLAESALMDENMFPDGTLDPAGDNATGPEGQVVFEGQSAIFEEFGGEYDIESRIGVWDDELFAIVPG